MNGNGNGRNYVWQITLGFLAAVIAVMGYLADKKLESLEDRIDAIRDQVVKNTAQSEANRQLLESFMHK